MSPGALTFDSQTVGVTSPPQSVRVTNNSAAADRIIEISASGDFAQANSCTGTLKAGGTCSISVTFTPVAPGPRTGALTVVDGSPKSPQRVGLTGTIPIAPAAPLGATAQSGIRGLLVSWSPPAGSGSSALAGYTVIASPGDATVTADAAATSAWVGGLAPGLSYTFSVRAGNAQGLFGPPAFTAPASPYASFYFAEGFTGMGFTETLDVLMPNHSGTAFIDLYTSAGVQHFFANLVAGQVFAADINRTAGADEQVSARVLLPFEGVVERRLSFSAGAWHGQTDSVGAPGAANEWDFAEGSTLSAFSEYLTLQNANPVPVAVDLHYYTDSGLHPVKTAVLPPNSRTTVEVARGDSSSSVARCVPSGPVANCGVGGGVGGVSVSVLTQDPALLIVAERPLYVNGADFGYGAIRDGHVAFGAPSPKAEWSFAEGSTLAGFSEYLTLQNPGTTEAAITLSYQTPSGPVLRAVAVPHQQRVTVEVFRPAQGVGVGAEGVSVGVASSSPIVAERSMYVYHDFGFGAVAGATVAVGATSLGTVFGFSSVVANPGQNTFLTIQNPGRNQAAITVDYYTPSGRLSRALRVAAQTRFTVQVFAANTPGGLGWDSGQLGAVVSSSQPVQLEKSSYDANIAGYGATVTGGFSPPGGSF